MIADPSYPFQDIEYKTEQGYMSKEDASSRHLRGAYVYLCRLSEKECIGFKSNDSGGGGNLGCVCCANCVVPLLAPEKAWKLLTGK